MEKERIREQFSIYNTFDREQHPFEPMKPPNVGLYVCGPTVYGDPHLGHARSAITFDVLFRYLEYMGYKVRYVRNITDVGHLEDEVEGEGEDKVAKKARLEKLEPMEIVQYYSIRYHDAMDKLNNRRPSIEPSASGHIPEQMTMVQRILDQGLAYEVNGSVYFDMKKYLEDHEYGKLSGKVVDDLIAGSRDLEGQEEKRFPLDFALWKKATPTHIMRWDSPWGEGFPGWHLECSAMSAKYLGVPFDIHGGGMDLQFPHHECEIAQTQGAHEQQPVRYWMHNNLLTINGQKMSKSLGNFVTLIDLFSGDHQVLERAYDPMTIRFFMLQSHYRSTLDFSNEALQAAEKGLERLMKALQGAQTLQYEGGTVDEELDLAVRNHTEAVYSNLNDDLNTAKALAALFELASKFQAFYHGQLPVGAIKQETFEWARTTFRDILVDVLGLEEPAEEKGVSANLEAIVKLLIEVRDRAREKKDFELADMVRDKLREHNIQLKDEKDGTTWEQIA